MILAFTQKKERNALELLSIVGCFLGINIPESIE